MSQSHTPDSSRLPKLGEWRPMDVDVALYDGTQFLAAVPVRSGSHWYYEYSVVTVRCDEHYFELRCNDDTWGWELEDVDFFVVLSGSVK